MEKTELTEGARAKLRELLHSPEGYEIKRFMGRLKPLSNIADDHHPLEVAALTGARAKGWEEYERTLEDISDPNYGENNNLK
jgi:hypothetical protein